MDKKIAFVTGASGFIGHWVVRELLKNDFEVIALFRNPEVQFPRIKTWLGSRGVNSPIRAVKGDLTQPDFALESDALEALSSITHIFHLGGSMRWNMSRGEARGVNLAPLSTLVTLAKNAVNFQRFVQFSGFMIRNFALREEIGLANCPRPAEYNWNQLYRRFGGYEASKFEFHFKLVNQLQMLKIPYTVIHPASVIGDSESGEVISEDLVSLADVLYRKKLPAIPGRRQDVMPLIPVDFLARFAVAITSSDETEGEEYVLLDPRSPDLLTFLEMLGKGLGVKVPRRRVPISWLMLLMKLGFGRWLPLPVEPLAFVTNYSFDTSNTERIASHLQLQWPCPESYIAHMALYLREQVVLSN
ncbi:SDR family oxidoreductase [Oleiphilus messinensis]|nr:SDR family oxidoreductase [Oleiphilus messinensis]